MEKGPSEFAEYWTSEFSAIDHYDRHGELLGYENFSEYLKGAKDFIENTNLNNILRFKAPNGSVYKFNKRTNEFAIVSKSGKIVTYYYLEGGEKAFWRILINENGVMF